MADLLARGFAVVAFDWRGQGLSQRRIGNPRKGHVRSFDEYRLDLEAIRDEVLIPVMPEPHFALCHSMGGAIALAAAAEDRLPFRRFVTTAPMIALSITRWPKGASRLAFLLNILGFGRSFVPGGGKPISRLPFAGNLPHGRSAPLRPQRRGVDGGGRGGCRAPRPSPGCGPPSASWTASGRRTSA